MDEQPVQQRVFLLIRSTVTGAEAHSEAVFSSRESVSACISTGK